MPSPEWFAASKSPAQVRQPKPGEVLFEIEMDGSRDRDHQPHRITGAAEDA